MLAKLLNQATLSFAITAYGPLLIKSGLEGGADPSVPDMQFVRTNDEVYLPGSSLKGVFRGYAEKLLRTVGGRCCDPLDDNPRSPTCSCGKRAERVREAGLDGPAIYRDRRYACRACQLFGSTAMAARIRFRDAYPAGDVRREVRTNVAIDRRKGSVAVGPFDLEVLTRATFQTDIQIRNFELWQLGLLGLVLRDLREGYVPLGFGKSRGLGHVGAELGPLAIRYVGTRRDGASLRLPHGAELVAEGHLYGVGALANEADRSAYGLRADDAVAVAGAPVDDWLGATLLLDTAARETALAACVEQRLTEVIRDDQSSA